MKRMMILTAAICLLALPVSAMDFTAPPAPRVAAEAVRPADSFSEGLRNVIAYGLEQWDPSLHGALRVCLRASAIVLLCAVVRAAAPGVSCRAMDLAATVSLSLILMEPSASLIRLGVQTVQELGEYGKLLLPVMTGALAAQGGVTASAGLYVGTVLFDTLLSACIFKLIVPMLYLYLTLSIANGAMGQELFARMKDFMKWLMTWTLKVILYLFTGYMAVTGVVSGSADAAAVKAAKITISAAVPVIGGILSDASEAVLVSAGAMRSAAGVYGVLTILALFVRPFLHLGLQYLILKALSAVCGAFASGSVSNLVGDFSKAMGILLAMVGTQSVLLLISTVCFMKGVG